MIKLINELNLMTITCIFSKRPVDSCDFIIILMEEKIWEIRHKFSLNSICNVSLSHIHLHFFPSTQ